MADQDSTADRDSRALVAPPATVFVVDDDEEFRESLRLLLNSVNLPVRVFDSAQAFLDYYEPSQPGCLVLDVRMPGMSGVELHAKLTRERISIPTIILTAYAEVRLAVQAMKSGAVDFLEKPYRPQELLDKIHDAIDLDDTNRRLVAMDAEIRKQVEKLTKRERQIMDLLIEGTTSKEIAFELNLSTKTVDFHRRGILRKMKATNVVEVMAKLTAAPRIGQQGGSQPGTPS